MATKKKEYEYMYLTALEPEPPLAKGVILEALLKNSGDTVGAVKIALDGFDLWRHGKKVRAFKTLRELFAYVDGRPW